MKNKLNMTNFKTLHHDAEPLILINIWDAASAKIIETLGAKALATSSASLAWSLGYPDGSALPEKELLDAVTRIQRVSNVPLSIDIENGYSDNVADVVALAKRLFKIGVVGINIEDGFQPPSQLATKINEIKLALPDLFVNARTDVFLANLVDKNKLFEETLTRLQLYKTSGADGVFIPALSNDTDIKQLQKQLNIPVNVMATDQKAVIDFIELGVERISIGPASFINAYQTLVDNSQILRTNLDTTGPDLSYEYLNKVLTQ